MHRNRLKVTRKKTSFFTLFLNLKINKIELKKNNYLLKRILLKFEVSLLFMSCCCSIISSVFTSFNELPSTLSNFHYRDFKDP